MNAPLQANQLTLGARVLFAGEPHTVRDVGRRKSGELVAYLHGLDECVPISELQQAAAPHHSD